MSGMDQANTVGNLPEITHGHSLLAPCALHGMPERGPALIVTVTRGTRAGTIKGCSSRGSAPDAELTGARENFRFESLRRSLFASDQDCLRSVAAAALKASWRQLSGTSRVRLCRYETSFCKFGRLPGISRLDCRGQDLLNRLCLGSPGSGLAEQSIQKIILQF